ncbi:hypothetical protein SMD11_1251 [Streptomyces albireticuli]|uniref:Uncharacterized protein n=1 Tax=Streptomyces albireticuli TaxID=1940 RepID=A0A1Z2KXY5_9ACTN|nr:hypothetical protein [Streptomyces albireticuli]ARZ66912.1 hypothetical protein SMD11_1251 [Streptomyces albireticuli]
MTAAPNSTKSASAKKSEAKDEPTVFEHNGISYTVPAPLIFRSASWRRTTKSRHSS